MGILAAAVRELMALGVEGDALVAAIERLERADNETRLVLEAEERRRHEASAGAIRQRRYRERKASRVTSPASPIVTSDAPSPKDIPTSSSTSSLDQNPNPPPLKPPALAKPETDFDRFWRAYPSKVSKRAAEKSYRRARARADEAAILAGVERAKRSRKWREGFIQNPATWLNGDGWLDEEPSEAPATAPSAVADWPDSRWRAALEQFAESRGWSDALGPKPGEPHCRAPPAILAEFGYSESAMIHPFERVA